MAKVILKNIAKNMPQKPGVYIFKDVAGRIVYIGKAKNLQKRARSHFKTSGGNNSPSPRWSEGEAGQPPLILREGVIDIDWIETKDENQAFLLENQLIKKYQPRYNIQWRDDKSYFWVKFTNDEWPRVVVGHKPDSVNRQTVTKPVSSSGNVERENSSRNRQTLDDTGSPRFAGEAGIVTNKLLTSSPVGPFVSGRELRKTLRALRKILPFRTCKNSYEKPCLQWHLGLCPAHGVDLRFKNYDLRIIKYRHSLVSLSQILKLYAGEKIRFEAYDISNIQGRYATGSVIVFYGNKPSKQDYRKFRIRTVQGANDVAMIKEVLKRRLNHPEWPYPDLMLIDGGLAQLHAAASVTKILERSSKYFSNSQESAPESIPAIALAKQKEEIYTEYSQRPLKISQLPEFLCLAFQAIRNEAHRFAVFYYRYLHEKRGFGKSHAEIRKTRSRRRKA